MEITLHCSPPSTLFIEAGSLNRAQELVVYLVFLWEPLLYLAKAGIHGGGRHCMPQHLCSGGPNSVLKLTEQAL